MVQADKKCRVGYTLVCKYNRNYNKTHKKKYPTFQDYLKSNDFLRLHEELNYGKLRKTAEELKIIKAQYDKDRRANYTDEDIKKLRESNKRYSKTPKGRVRMKKINEARYSSPEGNIASRLRAQLWSRLDGRTKKISIKFLPYTILDLKQHLENLFETGMNWNNKGKWHIDHIVPLKFQNENGTYHWDQEDLANPSSEQFKQAWSLANLQPKWAIDNLAKGNRKIG